MRIEHIAIWTRDLERLRTFYETYFGATADPPYHNPARHFSSSFLRFTDGARLELMTIPDLPAGAGASHATGYAHLALSLGSAAAVDALTARLRAAGHAVLDGPRTTGDGYYESAVLDPDGNRIELTI